jgi:phosphatase NudJ
MSESHIWKPNVTVAAIIERDGRYLLVEEHTQDGLRLNQPAGHLECGESPISGVIREALEETTHHFEPCAFQGVYMAQSRSSRSGEIVTYLRLAFSGKLGEQVPGCCLDEGIVRTVWMTPEDIQVSQARHRSPLVWQCVADHLAGKAFPLDAIFTHNSVLETLA